MGSRYFKNNLIDFVPGSRIKPDINVEHWKGVISQILETIIQQMPPTFDNCDGSLYVGCAGVAYMLHYIGTSDVFPEKRHNLLTKARNYIDVSLSYVNSRHNRDQPPAFLLGNAGPYAAGAMIYADTDKKAASDELLMKYKALANACEPVDYLPKGSDELLVGRAGFISGAYALNRKFGEVIPKEVIRKLHTSTIHSGRNYSRRHSSSCPLMYAYYDTEYLGAGHGLSGILQMLLCMPSFVQADQEVERDVRASVDYLTDLLSRLGNVPAAAGESDTHLYHWCHGNPGVVYLFAKAWLVWHDNRYLSACIQCGESTWQKGLIKKGPGICHGVAGSGYVFLLLYRLTADEKWLCRALRFAEFLFTAEFQQSARTPDTPYSLYEGMAGTACFLTDLLQPNKAEFPMFDVFSYSY